MCEGKTVFTVQEFAQLIRVSVNTAYHLVQSGKVLTVRVGRQYRIPRQAVVAYLCGSTGDCA